MSAGGSILRSTRWCDHRMKFHCTMAAQQLGCHRSLAWCLYTIRMCPSTVCRPRYLVWLLDPGISHRRIHTGCSKPSADTLKHLTTESPSRDRIRFFCHKWTCNCRHRRRSALFESSVSSASNTKLCEVAIGDTRTKSAISAAKK